MERGHHRTEKIRHLLMHTVAATAEAAVLAKSSCGFRVPTCGIPSYISVATAGGDILDVWFNAEHKEVAIYMKCPEIIPLAYEKLADIMGEWNDSVGPGGLYTECLKP